MRLIGTISDRKQAECLTDYLFTLGIRIQVEPAERGIAVWAIDEDRVAQARAELDRFQQHPDDERYRAAERKAGRLRDQLVRKEKEKQKNIVDVRSRWALSRGSPLTVFLIVVSCLVAFANGFGEREGDHITQSLLIASHDADGFYHPVFRAGSELYRGQVWRLLTPIFLHFGPMHLVMNMLATHSLGSLIEMRRGAWRLGAMVLAIAVLSNIAQYLYHGPSFGGMSGVAFGLFGYAWMQSEFDPGSGMHMPASSVAMMLGWLVICMTTDWLGPVANAAHLAGLVAGVVLGYGPCFRRRLLGR